MMNAMIRLPTLIGLSMLALSGPWHAEPAQAAGTTPLCIYDGNSFSEGAHICAQASLVMTCSIVADRPVWKVVTDREVSRLCVTPSRDATGYRERRHVVRRSPANVAAPPADTAVAPSGGSGKCFTFNGKRFCE